MIRRKCFVEDAKFSTNADRSVPAASATTTRKINGFPALSLCMTGTVLLVNTLISSAAYATSASGAGTTVTEPTVLAAAVSQGIQQTDESAGTSVTFEQMLAQVTQVTQVTGGSTSTRNNGLLVSRTHELMMVDEREVDEVAARLKEIIRARYDADNLNIETMAIIDDLRKRIADYENLLKNADAQKQALLDQKGDLQEKVEQVVALEAQFADNKADYAGLKGKYNNLVAENENAKQEAEGVLTALNEKEKQLADLRAQLDDTMAERDSAQAEVAAVEGILNKKSNTIDDLNRRLSDLSAERDRANEELLSLQNSFEEADTMANNLLAERNDLAGTLSLVESKAGDFNSALVNEQQDHAQTRNLVAALENDLGELQAELSKVVGERDLLSNQKAHLDSAAKDLGDRLAGLEEELDTRQNELQASLTAISDLNGQIGALTSERDAANVDLESLQVEMDALRDQMALAQNKANDSIAAANNELTLQRATLDSEIAVRDQSLVEQEAEIERLNTVLEQRKLEIADKESAIGNLEHQVTELETSKAHVVAVKSEGEEMLEQLQTEIAGLVLSRDSAATQVDQLKSDNSNLSALIEETTNDLNTVTREGAEKLASLKQKITDLETSGIAADEQIAQLSAVNADLESELDATRNKLEMVSAEGSDQVRQLLAQISDLEMLVADLQSRESDLNDKIKVFEQASNSLLDQLELSQRDNRVAEGDIGALRQRLSEYQGKLLIANQKLADVEAAEQLAQAERESVVAEAESLRVSLTDELNRARLEHVTVQKARADNSIPLRLGNADFFAPGSAVLTKQGGENLTQLVGIIQAYHDRRIVVEGHTDNVPIGAALKFRFQSNWELSVARAAAAVRHMQSNTDIDPTQLSAAGYGEYRPVAANDTAEGRQQNRRVEVVLYPRTEKYNDVDTLKNKASIPVDHAQTTEKNNVDFNSEDSSVSSLEE